MAVVRKKQDDKNLKTLRELVTSGGGNRECFDCGQKGPTYVNMTIGSFVCTRCSGLLRGLTPPHRVKSISMATFTPDEIDYLRSHGNEECAKTWLGLWDPKRIVHQEQRELIIDKYERKRYYLEPGSPLKSLPNATKLSRSNSNNSSSTTNSNTFSNNNNNNNNLLNGNSISNGISNKHTSSIDASLKNITLTPPSSRSHSSNGSLGSNGSLSKQQQQLHQNGFNGFHRTEDAFTSANNVMSNGMNGHHAISRPTVNKSNLNISTSSANISETSSCNSSGFTPDSDFVADFNSANIFDATSKNGSKQNGGLNGLSVNGRNGTNNNHVNGGVAAAGNENFADFDHAPIYNAAGLPISNSTTSSSLSSSATLNSPQSSNSNPSADRYAALKDLDEQLRESKAVAAQAAAVVATSVVDSFNTMNGSSANPFKISTQQTPQIANPFQPAHSQTQVPTFNTQVPALFASNGPTLQQAHQQAYLNYTNGFPGTQMTPMVPTVPNGCGFGFGSMQQQIATGGAGSFNPFAATGSLGSNNPFL